MKEKINEKLYEKLINVPKSESEVVYILSRIRKILEIDKKKVKYSDLNFYCNWALHSIINKPPKLIHDNLIKIKYGYLDQEESAKRFFKFIQFIDLHNQLRIFLAEYKLPEVIYTEKYGVRDFNKLLLGIYSDTPIELTIEEKFEVKIGEDMSMSIKTTQKPQ